MHSYNWFVFFSSSFTAQPSAAVLVLYLSYIKFLKLWPPIIKSGRIVNSLRITILHRFIILVRRHIFYVHWFSVDLLTVWFSVILNMSKLSSNSNSSSWCTLSDVFAQTKKHAYTYELLYCSFRYDSENKYRIPCPSVIN